MPMQWPPDAKLDRGALAEASRAYVRHLLDGAHKEMGVVVVVVNTKTGAFHWSSSVGASETRELLRAAQGASQNLIAVPAGDVR